jgi:HD-like signal output (HDOD) protein
MNVLIVGSEPAPLVGDGAFLLRQVATGGEAIGQIGAQLVEVVLVREQVVDVDSRQLLAHVKAEWPTIVRIREMADGEQRVDTADDPAHRVVPRAFDAGELEHALLRAAELRGRLDQGLTTSIVRSFGGLPSAPATWTELSRHLSHPLTASVSAIAAIVERDVALTAQVLRQANSALLARGHRVTSVQEAVVRLGFQTLQQLVLGAETSRMFARATEGGVSVETLSDEGLERGVLAASLVTRRADRPAAFVAGMMLEVGQLVTACFLPDQTRRLRALSRKRGWSLHEAEAVSWGVTHADIGAHLLDAWNLPAPAIAAAGRHHEAPARAGLVGPATAARVARFAVASQDPLEAVDELRGWGHLLELAQRDPIHQLH